MFFLTLSLTGYTLTDYKTTSSSLLKGFVVCCVAASFIFFFLTWLFIKSDLASVSKKTKLVCFLGILFAFIASFLISMNSFSSNYIKITAEQQNAILNKEYTKVQQSYNKAKARIPTTQQATEQTYQTYQATETIDTTNSPDAQYAKSITYNLSFLEALQQQITEALVSTANNPEVNTNYNKATSDYSQVQQIIQTFSQPVISSQAIISPFYNLIQLLYNINLQVNTIMFQFFYPYSVMKLYENYCLFNNNFQTQFLINYSGSPPLASPLSAFSSTALTSSWRQNADDSNLTTKLTYYLADGALPFYLSVFFNSMTFDTLSNLQFLNSTIVQESVRVSATQNAQLIIGNIQFLPQNNLFQEAMILLPFDQTNNKVFSSYAAGSNTSSSIFSAENVLWSSQEDAYFYIKILNNQAFLNNFSHVFFYDSTGQEQVSNKDLCQFLTNTVCISNGTSFFVIEFFGFLPKNITEISLSTKTNFAGAGQLFLGVNQYTNLAFLLSPATEIISGQNLAGSMSGFLKLIKGGFWCTSSISVSQIPNFLQLPTGARIYQTPTSWTFYDPVKNFVIKRSFNPLNNCVFHEVVIGKTYRLISFNIVQQVVTEKTGILSEAFFDSGTHTFNSGFLASAPATDWISL